jgi:hypothetical protein
MPNLAVLSDVADHGNGQIAIGREICHHHTYMKYPYKRLYFRKGHSMNHALYSGID